MNSALYDSLFEEKKDIYYIVEYEMFEPPITWYFETARFDTFEEAELHAKRTKGTLYRWEPMIGWERMDYDRSL